LTQNGRRGLVGGHSFLIVHRWLEKFPEKIR
jgi:hypothetical protein